MEFDGFGWGLVTSGFGWGPWMVSVSCPSLALARGLWDRLDPSACDRGTQRAGTERENSQKEIKPQNQ